MAHGLFRFFASLKLAVFCLLSLAAVLATATALESLYGMRAAHMMVYGTLWFSGLLFLLGLNVLCAALSRYPWKKHQTGFVITHAGILIILLGSFATKQFGVDGNLPIYEKGQENSVILNDLVLAVYDQDERLINQFPVPESGIARSGHLMQVDMGTGSQLLIDQFLPRVTSERVVTKSPMVGVGAPAVKVELFNGRFRMNQWLLSSSPKPSEISLGPAILSLQKLWREDEVNKFLKEEKPSATATKAKGYLIVTYEGREFRVQIDDTDKSWTKLGSKLELQVERYMPYAIVENNQLVNKSSEPVNPTVQVVIRDIAGNAEHHTIFANFPELNTLQRARLAKTQAELGLKFRFVASGASEQPAQGMGSPRGQLRFAVSPDGQKLFYRIETKSSNALHSGVVETGKEEPTGWMDLKFKVTEWYPFAVEDERPHYVEFIQGSENFLSGVHVRLTNPRSPASQPEEFWLSEGSAKPLYVDGRQITLQYTKRKLLLPYFVRLNKFTVGMDPGTSKAASYSSEVVVEDRKNQSEKAALISMNEPLNYGGYTLYQASYQMEEGRPPLSVLSVNYDPGRPVKYIGSIVMTLGILIMFYMNPHYFGKVLGRRKDSNENAI